MTARVRIALAGGLAIGALLALGACGLGREGLGPEVDDGGGVDGTTPVGPSDASARADGAPPSDAASAGDRAPEASPCTTLDASCLGALPPGWKPIAVVDGGCGAGFSAQPLVTNPRLLDGGCACAACEVQGTFACEAGVAIHGGDNCGDPTLVTVAPGSCVGASAQHIKADPPPAGGSPTCTSASDAGTGVTTDSLATCVPSCTADYCGQPSRCVVAPGSKACPPGFMLLAHAGTGADPGCAPCSCTVAPPGNCGGTVTAWGDTSCSDAGGSQSYAIGDCNQVSTWSDYAAVTVEPTPPTPTCTPTSVTRDTGDASLTGEQTICCR